VKQTKERQLGMESLWTGGKATSRSPLAFLPHKKDGGEMDRISNAQDVFKTGETTRRRVGKNLGKIGEGVGNALF